MGSPGYMSNVSNRPNSGVSLIQEEIVPVFLFTLVMNLLLYKLHVVTFLKSANYMNYKKNHTPYSILYSFIKNVLCILLPVYSRVVQMGSEYCNVHNICTGIMGQFSSIGAVQTNVIDCIHVTIRPV